MNNNYPKIVCWRITSNCGRNCPFCFRPKYKDLKTNQICKIINALAVSGVKGIGITGGEPLSRKDIAKILEYIRAKKISICLATNADFYSKYQNYINKYVATIGIPIEGATKEIHESLRGKNNFRNIMNAIDKIYKNSRIKMYFSTVMTKNNIDDLANIEKLLAKYGDRVIYWKIYEVINYRKRPFQSLKNQKIPGVKIKKAIGGLGKSLGKEKILYLSAGDRSEASFIINSNGGVVVPIQGKTRTKDVFLGDLLKDKPAEIFAKWNKIIDFKKYQCHRCALKCSKEL